MGKGKLLWRHLTHHPVRSFLTMGSMTVALLLLCLLRSLVTTLEASVSSARSDRLWVQSAVSLFVDLPISYQTKIEGVAGVLQTCKWQWFGGYYQDPGNFFAQFAVDAEKMLDMYPEAEIVDGSRDAFLSNRTGCLVGEGLAEDFGWKVGDTVPIIGALYPHPDGTDTAWEFRVEAIYRPGKPNFDRRTMFFHWDLFEKTLESGEMGTPGTGTFVIQIAPGVESTAVMSAVDTLFENGPQRVQTTTESEFQAQFASMVGNIPFFVSSIGGAVFLAILLASMNTMLMAGREQTHDIGILKALGFSDASLFGLLIGQALLLSLLGGLAGVALAILVQGSVSGVLGPMFPEYHVTRETVALGIAITFAVGIAAGVLPALRARGMNPVEALRETI